MEENWLKLEIKNGHERGRFALAQDFAGNHLTKNCQLIFSVFDIFQDLWKKKIFFGNILGEILQSTKNSTFLFT
jgi:hypothetical protein